MRTIVGLCALALVSWTGAYAQAVAGFGGITGTVTDASANDGLPDATLVLSNESLGFQRTFLASDDGIFDMPALVPGAGYSLKVTRKGYAPKTVKDVQVQVGQTLNLIVPMDREGGAARVERFQPPRVDDTKNVVSTAVPPMLMESLPSPARILDQYVLLAPAVTQDPRNGVIAFRGEAFSNSVLVDGNDATTTYNYSQKGITPLVPEDATSQMQVIGAAWPAELGHSSGGIVNVATRSGTSGIHGDAYDYFAEKQWTAPDRYAPGFADGARQNQGGGSVGGTLWPGKIFGFANFDALNSSSDGLFRVSNPLLTNATGTAILPANCKATPAQCTAADNFLNSLIDVTVPRTLNMRSGMARIDYRRSQVNNFTVEGNVMHRKAPDGILDAVLTPNSGPAQQGSWDQDTRYAKAGYTRTLTENMINEARASWYKDRVSEYDDSKLFPATTGPLGLNIAGTAFGPNPAFPKKVDEQRYQLLDNFTLTTGSNTLKGGVDYERVEDFVYQPLNFHASYDYPSLTAFADDFSGNTKILKNYTDFSQGFGNATTDLKPRVWAAYAQDTWKATQKFTVTAGVHWEMAKIPQPLAAYQNAQWYQTGSIGSPKTDFSPRLGLAYKLDDKTVARVGAGTYYQPFPGELMRLLYSWNGLFQRNALINPLQTGSPVFPIFFAPTAGVPQGTQEVAFAATKFRNPYTIQASAEVERSLAKGVSISVGYIDSRANKLWTINDQNQINATNISKTYTIDNAAGTSVGTYVANIFTYKANYSHAWQVLNEGESRYKAVDAQLNARLKYGLNFHASYTWSHSLDDVSGPAAFGFFPNNTNPGDYSGDHGDSNFDQRQRAVINFVWAPRWGQGQLGAAKLLLDGWQLSAIATLATGLPETPTVIVNGSQFNAVSMTYLSTLNGSDGWNRVPFQSVNSLRLESEHVVDARVTKAFIFTEQIRGMVMFEAFNALNSQFDTAMNTIAFTATSGVLHPVAGLGTGIQSYGPVGGTNARRAQVAFKVTF